MTLAALPTASMGRMPQLAAAEAIALKDPMWNGRDERTEEKCRHGALAYSIVGRAAARTPGNKQPSTRFARGTIVQEPKDHRTPPLTEAKRLLTEAREQLESLPSDDARIYELLARLWETLKYVAMEAELAQIEIARLAERLAKLEKPPR